jgi:serine protease Do
VSNIAAGGAAEKAGILPGDVIIEYNGRPVGKSDDLVRMVVATKPGTTVPIKVVRNKQDKTLNITVEELDLDAEQASRNGRSNDNNNDTTPPEQASAGFGLTLQNLTAQMARRLQVPSGRSGAVVTEVDPSGPAAAAVRSGDVILAVNRKPVSDAAEAKRELAQVASGRLAQLSLWREGTGEVFIFVKKD